MKGLTLERMREVVLHFREYGMESACKHFNLKYTTVGRYSRKYSEIEKQTVDINEPNIIVMDIETLPMLSYHFRLGKQHMGNKQIKKDWRMLSYAYKFLGEDEMYGRALTQQEVKDDNELSLIAEIWELFNSVDIIIGHNFKSFDDRISRAKFIEYGFQPPTPYQIIDTYTGIKNAKFTCHKLDYLGQLLVHKGKYEHDGLPLWIGCDNGEQKALDTMFEYNKEDVLLNEKLYLEVRPYLKNQANLSNYYSLNTMVCSKCGSIKVKLLNEETYTNVNRYDTYRCQECGGLSRSRFTATDKNERKNILRGV